MCLSILACFFLMNRRPPRSPLFPSTTLFRSLDRQKSEFITIASHELRTPLSIILGYSSILRDRLADRQSEYSEYVDERSEEHTSELQSRQYLVCRLLLEKKKILVPVWLGKEF